MSFQFREIRSCSRHLTAISLILYAFMVCSCDSAIKETAEKSKHVSQQFAGTLPVRILPDNACSLYDLRADYTGKNVVSYSWERNGAPIDHENTAVLSRNNYAKGDRITVTVRAGKDMGSATVVIGNTPPHLVSIDIEPTVIYTGVDIKAKPQSVDPDGDDIRYDFQWFVNEQEVFDNSPVLKGDRLKKGDKIKLVVTPSDGEERGNPFEANVITVSNSPPFFVSIPPDNFKGMQYTYSASAKDLDGDKITYSLDSAPAGMTIDPTSGMVNWPISKADAGFHEIEVLASDAEGAKSSQKYTLNITINSGMSQ